MKASSKPRKGHLTAHDAKRLTQALDKAHSVWHYRRVQGVWLVSQGKSAREAAAITAQTVRSVRRHIARYLRTRDPTSLADQPRSARPSSAEQISLSRLRRLLARSPLKLGYRSNVWTCRTLADYFKRHYKLEVSPHTMWRRRHALDFPSKRPRYFYAEKDPNRAPKKPPLCAA